MNIRWFLFFLLADLVSKSFAVIWAPNNSIFTLAYNPNMLLSLQAPDFVKFVLPLLVLPIPYLSLKFSGLNYPKVLALVYAGMMGNYLGRFSEQGVVDFINFQLFICNFADIYLWIGSVIIFAKMFPFLKNPVTHKI